MAFLLALLLAAPVRAAQIESIRIQRSAGLSVPVVGFQAPGLTLAAPRLAAPSLAAPALSAQAAVPAVNPAAAATPAPAVWNGLQTWYAHAAAEEKAPQAPELSTLWDGAGEGGRAEVVPGSVFDWKPADQSPGHGWPVMDRLARRVLGRDSGKYQAGYEMTNAAKFEQPRVFFYGERHSDQALIQKNMRRIAAALNSGRGAVILDEGYFGPRLYRRAALDYLERRGLDRAWLNARARTGWGLELEGWDDQEAYDESKHVLLQHHMNMLDLNGTLYSPDQGWRYYAQLAAKAYATFKNWRTLRKLAIGRRNEVLDRSISEALARVQWTDQTLHVIAGAEHLAQRSWLGGTSLRRGLARALKGRLYWAGKPADSLRSDSNR